MLLFKKRHHRRIYVITVGILFSAVGILHIIRAACQWEMVISGVIIPVWVSWVAGIGLLYLAYRGFTRNIN